MTSRQTTRARSSRPRRTSSFIGGEWRDAAAPTLAVEDPSTGETLVEVADATPDDAKAAWTPRSPSRRRPHLPRERGEILRRTFEQMTARADELALLMTLEMGKPLAESQAEIAYAAEFLRWFAEEAVRIEAASDGAQRRRAADHDEAAGRSLLRDHPWNFPAAMGTRKIGRRSPPGCTMIIKPPSRRRCRCSASPRSSRSRACPPECSTSSPELELDVLEADHLRPAASQADLHGLDRGRPQARRAVGAGLAAHLDGARRQRAVHRVPGRRRRRRRRGRRDRQDAQHRRGVHGRQPLPRRRQGRRRVHARSWPRSWGR